MLTVGFAVVHPTFLFVADWLGPTLGSSLLNVLTIIYIILGDPLQFTVLLALWAGAAFLAGVIIRRRVGSIVTILLVLVVLIAMLGINLLDVGLTASQIFQSVEGANPLDVLPPLPEGLTFVDLYEAPIVGDLAEKVLGAIQGDRPDNPMSIVYGIASSLAAGVLIKVAAMIAGALAGVEVGKLLEPTVMPFSESIRMGLGGKPRGAGPIPTIKEAISLLTIALILGSALLPNPIGVGAAEEDFYTEIIMGFADPSGRAYVGDLFASSETPFGDVSGSDGLLGSVIASHEGVKEIVAELMGSDMNIGSFTNVIPETLMIAVYIDVPPETAGPQSEGIADAFSEAYQIDLTQLMALNAPFALGESPDSPQLTIVLYQSGAEIGDLASTYLDQFLAKGGLVELISEASSNGRIVPQSTPDSADGGALFSGFVNVELLKEFVPAEYLQRVSEYFPVDEWEQMGFSGSVSFWDHGVESVGEGQGLDLLDLMGVDEAPSFSDDSEMSLVLLAAPNGTDIGGDDVPNLKITTNMPEDDNRLAALYRVLEMLGLIDIAPPEVNLDPSAFEIEVSGVILPLNIEVTKATSPSSPKPNSIVEVTVTVTNLDSAPMRDVTVDDSATIERYQYSSRLIGGSTSGQWSVISPGESRSISYSVEIGEGGIYSFAPAQISYLHETEEFSDASQAHETRVKRPSALSFGMGSLVSTGRAA
ncbi:MAG: hypothetical protein V3S09_06020, partial [Candidatus Bathyarchaeia archaeon]